MTLMGTTGAATTSSLSYDSPYSNRETQGRFCCSVRKYLRENPQPLGRTEQRVFFTTSFLATASTSNELGGHNWTEGNSHDARRRT